MESGSEGEVTWMALRNPEVRKALIANLNELVSLDGRRRSGGVVANPHDFEDLLQDIEDAVGLPRDPLRGEPGDVLCSAREVTACARLLEALNDVWARFGPSLPPERAMADAVWAPVDQAASELLALMRPRG
jgi:hypothetical protein